MAATTHRYTTAGLAVLAAAAVAATPVTGAPGGRNVVTASVRLTTGDNPIADVWSQDLSFLGLDHLTAQDWANVPQNLLADLLDIPYNFIKGVGEFAGAGWGFPGVVGTAGEPAAGSYDPADPNPVLEGGQGSFSSDFFGLFGPNTGTTDPAAAPYYAPIGVDHSWVPVGFGGTGSWWMESLGNTWGWDDGNFGQVLGISNMIVPIPQFSTPFADELQAAAMQQIVANPEACPFSCPNVLDYVGRWFNVPLDDMFKGVTVGLNYGPGEGTAADPTGSPIDPMGFDVSWAGDKVQFDPFFIFTSFFKSLTMDPTATGNTLSSVFDNYLSLFTNPAQNLIDPFLHLGEDLFNNFFPLLPGSFVYWGAPEMYSVPAWVGGLIHQLTGIANPMRAFTLAPGGAFSLGPYLGETVVGNGPDHGGNVTLDLATMFKHLPAGTEFPDLYDYYAAHDALGQPIGPLDLPAGLAAGMVNWINGLIGYLDPYTYLAGLGVTDHMTATQLAAQLGGDLHISSGGLTGLADFLTGWHDAVFDVRLPLAELSNTIAPWYADLTDGMAQEFGNASTGIIPNLFG